MVVVPAVPQKEAGLRGLSQTGSSTIVPVITIV